MKKVFAFKNYGITGSSSGGAFPTIVKSISAIEEKDIAIYGAAFDENLNVVHKKVVGLISMTDLQGSKYVQSKIGDCYNQVQEDLAQNAVVVFSGTPCQVQGLKKFLDNKHIKTDNLYLIDIICHGTAQTLLWNKYKEWMEKKYGQKLKTFSFRYHEAKSMPYASMALFAKGKVLVNTYDVQLYNRLFLSNLALQEGCYRCPFAKVERCGDITIGDFWGVEKLIPEFGERHSVSQILVNTAKGKKVIEEFEKLSDEIKMIEYEKDDYLTYQRQLNGPTVEPEGAKEFKKDLVELPFEIVLKKYMKYGIVNKMKFYIKKYLQF